MKSSPTQRPILLTLLYCCAAALISGVCSTRVSESHLVSPSLSTSETWRAAARSLTSTEKFETTEVTEATDETTIDEPQADSELIKLQSFLPQLYHTPEVFALNYTEMIENLKVFIYPNSQNVSYEYNFTSEKKPSEGRGSELQFLNLLKANVFVTKDPEEAHLFFLPLSFSALVAKLGSGGVGHHLRHYLQDIRDHFTSGIARWDPTTFILPQKGMSLLITETTWSTRKTPSKLRDRHYRRCNSSTRTETSRCPRTKPNHGVESRNPTAVQQVSAWRIYN